MKNILKAAVASLLLTATSAFATTYSDNNPADVWFNTFNKSYTGTFTLSGYNPAVEEIVSADVEFQFFDLVGNESLKIVMNSDIYTHGSFSGVLYLGGGVGVNALADLSADGILSYTITRLTGEFWLTNASITATAVARNVPDAGASLILVGLGLAGIWGARRRRAGVR